MIGKTAMPPKNEYPMYKIGKRGVFQKAMLFHEERTRPLQARGGRRAPPTITTLKPVLSTCPRAPLFRPPPPSPEAPVREKSARRWCRRHRGKRPPSSPNGAAPGNR